MLDLLIYFLYHRARRSGEPLYSSMAMFDAILISLLVPGLILIPTAFYLKEFGIDVTDSYDALSRREKYLTVLFTVIAVSAVLRLIVKWKRNFIYSRFKYFESLPNGKSRKGEIFVYIMWGFTIAYFVSNLMLAGYRRL